MTAGRAAYNAFTDPESQLRDMTQEQRIDAYWTAWLYYSGEMYDPVQRNWAVELAQRDLYKHTRLIYNPVPQIVDFYADNIWQHAENEQFESLVTPATEKTDEALLEAIAQIDQWSNFASESFQIKRYGAGTGNVLIEGIDDLERRKVLHRTVWPGFLTAIDLNATGDLLGYTLEYNVYDADLKGTYRYKKVVDRDSYRFFRDDRPFTPPGETANSRANPYGFCFAVWIRHTDDGADYGRPAVKNFGKVDNLNSLASHMDDYIHKAIESPKLIAGGKEVLPIVGAAKSSSNSTLVPEDPRLNWVVFQSAEAATVHDLSGILKLADASPELKRQLDSFQNDYPELQAASIIRENSQLSGAALERMLGPAQNRLDGVQPNYNQQLIKLRQMQMAVGGMRTRQGWGSLTEQQRKFSPFNLDSYERGELDFNLKKSVLVQTTEAENEELLKLKAERSVTLSASVDKREQLNIAGYNEAQIDEILARVAAEDVLVLEDEERLVLPAPARQLEAVS